MYDIQIRDNYINIKSPEGNNNITDRKVSEIEFVRKFDTSDTYMVRYRGNRIDGLKDILFSDFSLEGVPFTDHQVFKDWKNANTAVNKVSAVFTPETPTYTTQDFPTGLNINVPAGKRSVTVARLSGTVTVNTGSGTFTLGGGSNPRAVVITGDEVGSEYGILPEIVISGGTWQWVASNVL